MVIFKIGKEKEKGVFRLVTIVGQRKKFPMRNRTSRRRPRNHNEESLNLKSLLKQSPPEKSFLSNFAGDTTERSGFEPWVGITK